MTAAAEYEGLNVEVIQKGLAEGVIVLPANINHKTLKPLAIGKGLSCKVNANIGTSEDFCNLENELEKLDQALKAGAHAVMDLSTAGNLDFIRQKVLEKSFIPVGTVPIYQAARQGKLNTEGLFGIIEKHAQDGVDFITVHCGITFETIEKLKKHPRLMSVVSRGGSMLIKWIEENQQENPLYQDFDCLLDICLKYDVTLSLGDGMRPGCLKDAGDPAQIQELIILAELTKRSKQAGVQVMIEGPGHVPYDQIPSQMQMQKTLCQGAPFYVLGPLPCDFAPGYDHITSAIGGALAAFHGADFLCYVTPAEHLALPNAEDVFQGVMASRIAAYCADMAKGIKSVAKRNEDMAIARRDFDWEKQASLAIDPQKARDLRQQRNLANRKECSMCGDLCAMKVKLNAV